MRIGEGTYYRQAMNDLYNLQSRSVTLQDQISSGIKVSKPSEASGYSYTILSSNQAIAVASQYQTNLNQAKTNITASTSAMESLLELVQRAKTLAEQMSTGTQSAETYATTASEVNNILAEIMQVANTQVQGSYIFGGSDTTNPAISSLLVCTNPSTVYSQSSTSNGSLASVVYDGTSYQLNFTRSVDGSANTVTLSGASTLGAGLGLDFTSGNWTHSATASSTTPDSWTSDITGLTSANSTVSDRIGETLTWDSGNGTQTYVTTGAVNFSGGSNGAAQVTVGTDTYTVGGTTAAESAADLTEQINSDPARGYYAWVDSSGAVRIATKDPANTYTLTETADPGNVMNVDGTTSLQEVANAINAGGQASGTVHLDDANLPAATDTISLGGTTYNWGQICPASVSFSGAAAGTAQVTIGGTTFTVSGTDAATSAQDLADQINGNSALGYYAVVNGGQVSIYSQTGGAYLTASITADPDGVLTVTQPPPATAAEFASDLSSYVNTHSSDFTATSSASGTGATVAILAKDTGTAGNLALTSSNANVGTSGATLGGLAGADTTGKLYLSGTSDLRQTTTVQAQVTAVDPSTGAVSLHLSWYGDGGTPQSYDVTLPNVGSSNAVSVPGLGDISIYRDSQNFKVGSTMELTLSRYQGNEEEMSVNFSTNQRMAYNWNATQLLGSSLNANLDGQKANSVSTNTGTGGIELSGNYSGLTARDLTFKVLDGGQVPGDNVTLRVTWTGDDQVQHQEDVTLDASGSGGKVELPNSDGIYLQIDNGSFTTGDTYTAHVDKSPANVLDVLTEWSYQMQNGTTEEAQDMSQRALQALGQIEGLITDAEADAGSRQSRITVRSGVLDDTTYNQQNNLANLEDVDFTSAYIELTALQSSYTSSLKVMSTVSQLSLLDYIS